MKRPSLKNGDLVKRKKPHDDGTMYRVVCKRTNRIEKLKLGLRGRKITSHEGFVDVYVMGLNGERHVFKRRDLWRVPNQPRDKKTKSACRESDYVSSTSKTITIRI